jgi:tRNA(Ile)-lysidine synthase
VSTRVVVGCSGGADSLALLALTCNDASDVIAVYVDHGLRAGTAHDAAVVQAAAERFGARFERVTVDIGDGANLEARARAARYDALERVRAAVGAEVVLVAHTRDDQAETVLLNLLRGSGTSGLAGMAAQRGYLRRPLLNVRRAEMRELCMRLGLAPVHDPMNDDVHHRRVWLRREVIPMLERGADRDIVEVLARQSDIVRDDDAYLDALAAEHATDDAATIAALDTVIARRVVRAFLGSPPPSLTTVERVLAVARGETVATEIAGGGRVQRVGGKLVRVERARPVDPVELPLPGRVNFGGIEIEAWIEHAPPTAWPDGRWVAVCDADLVPGPATVAAAPGAEPSGRFVPPVVFGEGIVWLVGYRVDRRVRTSTRTRRFLWMSAEPSNP